MAYFERRICSFTNQPINAKDKSSVQLLLAELDENGIWTGKSDIVDICGSVRIEGLSDSLLLKKTRESN